MEQEEKKEEIENQEQNEQTTSELEEQIDVLKKEKSKQDTVPVPKTEGFDFKWYVLRVQTGREEKVKETLEKRIEDYNYSDRIAKVLVPTEKVSEIKGGKKKVIEKKLFPGYVLVNMIMNDEVWYFVSETPGMGSFIGLGKPTPMREEDVSRIMTKTAETQVEPKLKVEFQKGDQVLIKEGPFDNFTGTVKSINPEKGLVRVIITIFGRGTEVELEYWQIEKV